MGTESYFEDINTVITGKLYNAKREIKAAIAWFTDADLVELLASKARSGVNVELIVADNEDNKRVNYDPLRQAGVNLVVFPQRGYGSMHHKFCIIDKEMVITGSYNWTINAKRNNGENIMIAKDKDTIDKYLKEFAELQRSLQNGVHQDPASQNGHTNGVEKKAPEPEKSTESRAKEDDSYNEFEKEWNVYINSNVLNYDKAALKAEGSKRAENTQGNPDVIFKCLDTVYQELLSDTTIDEHEVEMLKNRLEQRMTFYSDKANEDAVSSIHVAEINKIAEQKNLENSIINMQNRQEVLEAEKKAIADTKIPIAEEEKEKYRKSIEALSIEITPPPLRRRIWGEAFMLAILSFYLFVFYSSVIYTIMYGHQDARDYMDKNGEIPEIEVFNGEALSLAFGRGWTIVLFVTLFTILPFVLGYLFHQLRKVSKKQWAVFYMATALILDGLLAYLITKNVHNINYMAGRESLHWEAWMVFFNARFYIVLFLGAVPYLVWGGLLEQIWSQLDRTSKSELYNKQDLQIKQQEERIREKENEINDYKNRINHITQSIIEIKGRIENAQKEIFYGDHKLELSKLQIQRELAQKLTTLSNQKEKIISYLNKDRIPVSYSALKDRINTFLGGWDEWLYSYYSTKKANELVSESHINVNEWLNGKYNELEA